MQDNRGYCFVVGSQPNGITPILVNDSLSRNFYIPEIFPDLELYIERTNQVDKNATVSLLIQLIGTSFSVINFAIVCRYLSSYHSLVKRSLF